MRRGAGCHHRRQRRHLDALARSGNRRRLIGARHGGWQHEALAGLHQIGRRQPIEAHERALVDTIAARDAAQGLARGHHVGAFLRNIQPLADLQPIGRGQAVRFDQRTRCNIKPTGDRKQCVAALNHIAVAWQVLPLGGLRQSSSTDQFHRRWRPLARAGGE